MSVAAPPGLADATLHHRLKCRLDKVCDHADYVNALEDAIAAAEKGMAHILAVDLDWCAYADLPVPRGADIVVATDERGNTAVLWRHDGRYDTLVTRTPGFGTPVGAAVLTVLSEDA